MRIVDAERDLRRRRQKMRDAARRFRRDGRVHREVASAPCPKCGKPGPHFAPPSLGEPGFYICDR